MWQVSCALNDQKDSGWKHFHWLFFIQKNTIKKSDFDQKCIMVCTYQSTKYIFWSKLKKRWSI